MDKQQIREINAKENMEMFLSIDMEQLQAMAKAIIDAKRVFVAGFGRAGNCVKILAMNVSQMGRKSFVVGDNPTPSIHEGDLLVIGSGSGETKTMAIIAEQCKQHGAKLGLISGNAESTIGKLADINVVIPRKPHDKDSTVGARGSFYQVLVMTVDLIQAYAMQDLGLKGDVIGKNHNSLE